MKRMIGLLLVSPIILLFGLELGCWLLGLALDQRRRAKTRWADEYSWMR